MSTSDRCLRLNGFGRSKPSVPEQHRRSCRSISERTRHRISIERDVINGDNARADRAQKIVAGLCVLTFICGSFFMYRGHSYEGAAIITGVLGSVLVAFLVGTASRKSERVEKARIMTGQKLPPPFDTKERVGTDS